MAKSQKNSVKTSLERKTSAPMSDKANRKTTELLGENKRSIQINYGTYTVISKFVGKRTLASIIERLILQDKS